MGELYFLGRHQPRTDGNYTEEYNEEDRRLDYNKDDNPNWVDKPLSLHHIEGYEGGKVISQLEGENGAKYVIGCYDESNIKGKLCSDLITSGTMTQLSPRHKTTVFGNEEGITRIEKKEIEISLVKKARRTDDSCQIVGYGRMTNINKLKEKDVLGNKLKVITY